MKRWRTKTHLFSFWFLIEKTIYKITWNFNRLYFWKCPFSGSNNISILSSEKRRNTFFENRDFAIKKSACTIQKILSFPYIPFQKQEKLASVDKNLSNSLRLILMRLQTISKNTGPNPDSSRLKYCFCKILTKLKILLLQSFL